MARIIALRFPATCADCGSTLPAGSKARYYGRGRTYGVGCHPDQRGPGERGRRAGGDGDGLKWWGGQRVRATRCEDAPYYKCYGPQDDGGDYYAAGGDR